MDVLSPEEIETSRIKSQEQIDSLEELGLGPGEEWEKGLSFEKNAIPESDQEESSIDFSDSLANAPEEEPDFTRERGLVLLWSELD